MQFNTLFGMVKFSGIQLICLPVFIFAVSSATSNSERSFTINYERNSFSMDGKPFRYVSGSVHYFRVPNEYWRDRLRKVRAAGLNAVSTYVEWSQHELVPGKYSFKGDLNVRRFIEIAQEEGLYVILRPGPYICAERDLGGLPYWLLRKHPDIRLRTSDIKYTKYVERWTDVLMKELSGLWYGKGGPIILVQVENEYGSYFSCDYNYTSWLRDLFTKHVRNDAVLFTTDGASNDMLKCGKIPGVYATVDFGPNYNVTKAFEYQRKFEPRGPLINSEYYPGWLTHWGEKMARRDTLHVVKTLKEMLDVGANVNFYMFYGGTNFGFTAGANFGEVYTADITSYDYDAPISEAGDITEKYLAIRDVVHQYLPSANITVNSSAKGDYGEVTLRRVASMFSPRMRQRLGKINQNTYPLSFETLDQNFGYLLYETDISRSVQRRILEIKQIKDLAHVYINGNLIGNMSREHLTNRLEIGPTEGARLGIVVENLGRINFGSYLHDKKGILSEVKLEGTALQNWNMTGFELKNLEAVEECFGNGTNDCDNGQGFVFYVQRFKLPPSQEKREYERDSYLDVSHLTKGLIFINGFNLGRYWSWRGPQYTIYVPGVYLKQYPIENTIIVMEENIKMNSIKIKFTTTPIFT